MKKSRVFEILSIEQLEPSQNNTKTVSKETCANEIENAKVPSLAHAGLHVSIHCRQWHFYCISLVAFFKVVWNYSTHIKVFTPWRTLAVKRFRSIGSKLFDSSLSTGSILCRIVSPNESNKFKGQALEEAPYCLKTKNSFDSSFEY